MVQRIIRIDFADSSQLEVFLVENSQVLRSWQDFEEGQRHFMGA
jgi:hypothetical protein